MCPPDDQSMGCGVPSLDTAPGVTLDSPTTSELSLKRNFSDWGGGCAASGGRGEVSTLTGWGSSCSTSAALFYKDMNSITVINTV